MRVKMATSVNGAVSGTATTPAPHASSNGALETAKAAETAQPKLSNAELKAKAKAEKAARRAQSKDAKSAVVPAASAPAASGGVKMEGKGSKASKGSHDQAQRKQQQQQQASKEQPALTESRPAQPRRPSGLGRRPSNVARELDPRSEIPDHFSHIPMARKITITQAHRDVHPAVLALGQRMATFTLTDSIARLEATLLALRKASSSPLSEARQE
jgi:translation initiation factor eIF-2B subunit delta